jgi:polyferredoxin
VNDRTPLSFDAERERTQLYQVTRDGLISNVYSLTVRNLDSQDHTYVISAAGLPNLQVDNTSLRVPAGESRIQVITVLATPDTLSEPSHAITLTLQAQQDEQIQQTREARFLSDIRR